MLKIYLGDNLIDSDNYMAFSYSYKMFDDIFYLGSTASVFAEIKLPYASLNDLMSFDTVTIKEDDTTLLTLVVDDLDFSDAYAVTIKLTDILINTQKTLDFSDSIPVTAKDLLDGLCNYFEIPHQPFNFTNQDVVLNSYDNTISARQYIGMIAELAGGYAIINNLGELEIKTYQTDNTKTISITDDIDTLDFSDMVIVERVVYDFGALHYETSDNTSLYTIYLSPDNLFLQVITQEQFDALAANILNYGFMNIKIPNCNKFYEPGSQIVLLDADNAEIPILSQYNCSYFGAFTGSYETKISNAKVKETQVIKDSTKIRAIKQVIDQVSNQVSIAASQISENMTNIASLGISDQEINAKIQTADNNIEALSTAMSELILNSTEVGITLRNNSGNNILTNTEFYLNAETWTISDDAIYSILEDNTEIRNLSISDRALFLQNGMFRQVYHQVLGQEYTISFTYKQTATSNLSVRIYRGGYTSSSTEYIEVLNNSSIKDWTQISLTYTSTTNDAELVIISDNAYATIFDVIIQLGANKIWSPNYSEARGANYKFIADGLYIYDTSDLSNYIKISNNSITFYQNDTEKNSYGINEMSSSVVNATSILNIDGLIIKKISSNPNVYGIY